MTLVGTSTANNQLFDYDLVLNSLTLTSKNGQQFSALATPVHIEFMHLNGEAEPLTTLSLPQGTYTSATATVGVARFDCEGLSSSGAIEVVANAYGKTPASHVTVNLPTPITVGTSPNVLSLDLLVSKSATWTDCLGVGGTYSITPTFVLSSTTASFQPAGEMMTGLEGRIASVSVGANSFTVTAADGPSCINPSGTSSDGCPPGTANGPTWQVEADGDTALQGITDISQIQTGMLVDMDGLLQPDGLVLASRIAVVDANPNDLTFEIGSLLMRPENYPGLVMSQSEAWGPVAAAGTDSFSFGNATFRVAGPLANLHDLPFTADFTGSNMVAGQRLIVTSHATALKAGLIDTPATTITLLPQTVDGTVSAVSSDSGFNIYTVTLAPYDLFPVLAVQGGQTTLLRNPDTVVVYVGNDTQLLNTTPLAVGSVLRFNGLIFNDQGTLRMDCGWVRDGVPE